MTREEYAERLNATIPDEPDIPDVAAHVWIWFWQLSQRRTAGFDSPNPLLWSEMEAWQRLTQTLIIPEEIDLLLMMDSAWLEAVAQHREEMKDKK